MAFCDPWVGRGSELPSDGVWVSLAASRPKFVGNTVRPGESPSGIEEIYSGPALVVFTV